MFLVGELFAGLAGLIHVLIFVMESVLFRRPEVYRRFMVASDAAGSPTSGSTTKQLP